MSTDDKKNGSEPEEIIQEVGGGDLIATLSRAEIDSQVATAKRYPRSIKAFRDQAMELATLDEETSGSMFYCLVRGGRRIEGPSVRLAEVAGSSWGNLYYGARVVDVAERVLRAQGVAWDLEKNVKCCVEVSRRITTSKGKRYDDDMITVTGNAACKIGLRNAIFTVIPGALIKPIYEAARQISLGKGLTMEQRRQRALDWFAKLGVKPEEILALLGRHGVEDVTLDDLVTLQGLRTAIMDGDTSVEEAFREIRHPAAQPGATGSKLDQYAAALKQNGGAKDEAPTGAAAPVVTDTTTATAGGVAESGDDKQLGLGG